MEFGAEAGIWKVTQDGNTLHLRLWKYGRVVEEWQGEKPYTFDELYAVLLEKSYEKRREE